MNNCHDLVYEFVTWIIHLTKFRATFDLGGISGIIYLHKPVTSSPIVTHHGIIVYPMFNTFMSKLKGILRDHSSDSALNFHKIRDFCIFVMILDV